MSQDQNQVINIVNNILHEKFEVAKESLVPEASLKEDLKLDSLDFVDMFIMLEEQTGGNVQNVDFMSIRTLGDIYNLVGGLELKTPLN